MFIGILSLYFHLQWIFKNTNCCSSVCKGKFHHYGISKTHSSSREIGNYEKLKSGVSYKLLLQSGCLCVCTHTRSHMHTHHSLRRELLAETGSCEIEKIAGREIRIRAGGGGHLWSCAYLLGLLEADALSAHPFPGSYPGGHLHLPGKFTSILVLASFIKHLHLSTWSLSLQMCSAYISLCWTGKKVWRVNTPHPVLNSECGSRWIGVPFFPLFSRTVLRSALHGLRVSCEIKPWLSFVATQSFTRLPSHASLLPSLTVLPGVTSQIKHRAMIQVLLLGKLGQDL